MITAVQQLLQAFDALPEADEHKAAPEILRRTAQIAPIELPDETLVEAAEQLFRELDKHEAADARR